MANWSPSATAGRAVLLVSAELSEILALSDRILVMYEGRILADLPRAQASEEALGLLMAGPGRRERARDARCARLRPPAGAARDCVRRARRRRRWCSSPAPIRSTPMRRSSIGALALGQPAQHAELGDAAGRHDARRGDSAARRHDQSRRRRPDGHRRAGRRGRCRSICPRRDPLAAIAGARSAPRSPAGSTPRSPPGARSAIAFRC